MQKGTLKEGTMFGNRVVNRVLYLSCLSAGAKCKVR